MHSTLNKLAGVNRFSADSSLIHVMFKYRPLQLCTKHQGLLGRVNYTIHFALQKYPNTRQMCKI